MLPSVTLFGRQISMYALCIMIGLFLGILAAVYRKKYNSGERMDILFASIYATLGVAVGGKIMYLLTVAPAIWKNRDIIFGDIENIKALMSGGFVFYGGLFGALLGIFFYAKQYKLDTFMLIERIIPSVPLVHAFGRLGCFCAGCCYGIPFTEPIGVAFKASLVAPNGIALFPVQLLEAICNLLLFFLLLFLFRKRETKGFVTAIYLMGYGIIRFCLEFLRFDSARGFLLHLSTSQWISLACMLSAAVIFVKLKKSQKKQL